MPTCSSTIRLNGLGTPSPDRHHLYGAVIQCDGEEGHDGDHHWTVRGGSERVLPPKKCEACGEEKKMSVLNERIVMTWGR